MQNTSFQRSILRTILHFTLLYAMATGCNWWKSCTTASVDKSTKITITPAPAPAPPAIPEEKMVSKETDPDDPTKESLDGTGKEEEEEDYDVDKEIKKFVEELIEDPSKPDHEKNPLMEGEEEKTDNSYIDPYGVKPIDPEFPNHPPPAYEDDTRSLPNNHPVSTSSNQCKKCLNGNNTYEFNEKDIENLMKNPSLKRKFKKQNIEFIQSLKKAVKSYKKEKLYKYNEKLSILSNDLKDLSEKQDKICIDRKLCSKHKAEALENIFIKTDEINLNMKFCRAIIQKIEEKGPYPKQPYGPASGYSSNGPTSPIYDPNLMPSVPNYNEPPPSYSSIDPSLNGLNSSYPSPSAPSLYPPLEDYK